MEISILLNSCRDDYPIIGLPDTFLFDPTVRSLNHQELQNFELVIIDALYSEKRKHWLEEHAKFPLKYLNAFPNRWLENGMCGIATQKNRGLLFCEGGLVVFIDDCTQFPPGWTKRVSYWLERGFWPMSLTYYLEAGKPKPMPNVKREVPLIYHGEFDREQDFSTFLEPGEWVRDSRAKFVDTQGAIQAPGSWFYGGSSASLEALLRINGIDEHFDGKKGLEDVDTGIRLEVAGNAGKFIVDKDLHHIENWHVGVSKRILHHSGPTPACNYALLQHNFGNPVANKKILTRDDCDWIRENICPKCNNYARCVSEELRGKFFIESDGFEMWLRLQKTFDLGEERRALEIA